MSRLIELVLVMTAAAVISTSSSAEPSGQTLNHRYCTDASDGGTVWCGYNSLQQCRASASGTGAGCIENPWIMTMAMSSNVSNSRVEEIFGSGVSR